MRKILTLCAAVLMALTASAKIWDITPGHNHEGDRADCNLYIELDRGAQAGDTIRLADGTYDEPYSCSIKNNVVIMAADGAKPVVNIKGYFEVKANAKVMGIKFVFCGEEGNGYAFYSREDTKKYLWIEDCEFTAYTKYCITGSASSAHIDSVIVNNCYFHDNANSAIYFPKSTLTSGNNGCDKVKVTNCTFANTTTLNGAGIVDNRNYNNSTDATSTLIVDHCTFYNCSGYERMVHSYKSPLAYVSNCIMANPATAAIYATYFYGGEVKNCITYNTSGHRDWDSHPTITDCSVADPLFVDAANGNYTLGEGSPALTAGTDGKAIGDPRWVPEAKYYLKSNWDGSSDWTWKEMTKDGDNYKLEGVVIRGTGYNYSTKNDDPSPAYIEVKDIVNNPEYKDTVTLVFDPSAKTLTAENIKAYVRKNADGFYLVGDAKGWEPAAANLFTKNTDAVGDEYQLSTTLAENEGIKVCESNKDDLTWYLDGYGTEYKVLAEQAGKVIIYFRPNHDGGEGWIYSGYLYIKKDTGTAIDNIDASVKTVKMIENGQLIIIKNGVKYNAIGEMVK